MIQNQRIKTKLLTKNNNEILRKQKFRQLKS